MQAVRGLVAAALLLQAASLLARADSPSLTVLEPQNGAQVDGDTVTIRFEVSGVTLVPSSVPLAEAGRHPEVNRPGEGHLHFMLDLQPLVLHFDPSPQVFSNLPPGDHDLAVELVQNDHSPLSPPVLQQIRFHSGPRTMPNTGIDPARARDRAPWLLLGGALVTAAGIALRRRRR